MIVGISMMRDEVDVAETVLRHTVAEGVDHLIVADNLSTDSTSELLHDLAGDLPLTVIEDDELGYYQSRKMSVLAAEALELGAGWVLPFDADEIWYGLNGTIAEALATVPDDVRIVRAPGWDHIQRDLKPDGPFSVWRREQTQQLAKVAFRATPGAVLHMGNHDVAIPGRSVAGVLGYRHFQYRSLPQMIRKLRNGRQAYEASDIHPMHGTHWRAGGLKSDDELGVDWAGLCAEGGLVEDAAPIRWQP
jgi:hypothetical protein